MSESEKKYKVLFNLAPVGIAVIDSKNNIIEANDALHKILGISGADLISKAYKKRKYISSEGNELLFDDFPCYVAFRDKKTIRNFEIETIDEDGSPLWAMVTCTPFNEKGDLAILIVQDISEQKKAILELLEIEERYHQLMENSGLGIIYFDISGKILMINKNAVSDIGLKVTDILGKTLTSVVGPERGHIYTERLKLASQSRKPIQFEDCLKINNKKNWYLSTYIRILDKDENVCGVQVTSNNITIRKNTELQVIKSQKKLQRLTSHLEEKRENEMLQIAMNLHDDLGQKLTALNLNLAWIKRKSGIQSPAIIAKISDMHLIIQETIEGIREISSFLSPPLLYDLGLIPACNALLKKFGQQSGIKVNLIKDIDGFKVNNKISSILFRVLQESLTNIARHSRATLIRVILKKNRESIEFLITDNGIGIKEREINSMNSSGLSGIKERVKSVNGKFNIRGIKNTGTSIKVTIPFRKNM